MYTLSFDPRIEKDLRSIPKHDRRRILERIHQLKENPRRPNVEKLHGEESHRLRVGDYRVLFVIDDRLKTVKIYRIKHRREAYR